MVMVARQVTIDCQWRRSWKAPKLWQWAIEICNGSPKFSFEEETVGQNDWNLLIDVTRCTLLVSGKKNFTSRKKCNDKISGL